MARIAGINIPNHQHAAIALTAIFGIGRSRARLICDAAGLKHSTKLKAVSAAEMDIRSVNPTSVSWYRPRIA